MIAIKRLREHPSIRIVRVVWEMSDELKEKVAVYLKRAKPFFEGLKVIKRDDVGAEIINQFYTMATAYYGDAQHFYEEGEYFNALAALEYAEGWLDAGKTLGIFETFYPRKGESTT